MESERPETTEPRASVDSAESVTGAESSVSAESAEIKVLTCVQCEGPVPSNAPKCYTCGAPLTGKEFAYIPRQVSGPDIQGMIKWWAILSIGVFALGGFSFGIGSSLAFTAITLVYLIRILRAYYL